MTTTKLKHRQILLDLEVGGTGYALMSEQYSDNRLVVKLRARTHKKIGNCPVLWQSDECYDIAKPEGFRQLYLIATRWIEQAALSIRIKGGWAEEWSEAKIDGTIQDSIRTWKRRALDLMDSQIGWWPSPEDQAAREAGN